MKNKDELIRIKGLGEIRQLIRDEFDAKWMEIQKCLDDPFNKIRPYLNLGVFGNEYQSDVDTGYSQINRNLSFSLLYGPYDEENIKLVSLASELDLMSKNYPWEEDNLLTHISRKHGIWYCVATGDSNKNSYGIYVQKYKVYKIESALFNGDLEVFCEKNAYLTTSPLTGIYKTAFERIIVIGDDLFKEGVWREECAIVGAFGIGNNITEANLKTAIYLFTDLMYVLYRAAFYLTTYAFFEGTSHSLSKLSMASRIQISKEIIENLKKTSEIEKGLIEYIWKIEGFPQKEILKLALKNKKFEKLIIDDICEKVDLIKLSNLYVFKESEYTTILIKNLLTDKQWSSANLADKFYTMTNDKKNSYSIIGDLADLFPTQYLLDIIKSILLLNDNEKKLKPLDFFNIWQSTLTILLNITSNAKKDFQKYLSQISTILDKCTLNITKSSYYLEMTKDFCSRTILKIDSSSNNLGPEYRITTELLQNHCKGIEVNDYLKDLEYVEVEFSKNYKDENNPPRKLNLYVVLSQKGGVGKSFFAANLSAIIAKINPLDGVALLDTDFSGPTYGHLEDLADDYWDSVRDSRSLHKNTKSDFLNNLNFKPIAFKDKNIKFDIFPAEILLSSQLRATVFEEMMTSSQYPKDLYNFFQERTTYSHFVIDTPAELKGITKASLTISKCFNTVVFFIGNVDRHTYSPFPEYASILEKLNIKTAFVFNGVKKLDQIILGDDCLSWTDYLSTHPKNIKLNFYPYTNINYLTKFISQFSLKEKNREIKNFLIPWYHDIGFFESLSDLIKIYKEDNNSWLKIEQWLTSK